MAFIGKLIKGGIAVKAVQYAQRELKKPENQKRLNDAMAKLKTPENQKRINDAMAKMKNRGRPARP
jgi:hypothetical protein